MMRSSCTQRTSVVRGAWIVRGAVLPSSSHSTGIAVGTASSPDQGILVFGHWRLWTPMGCVGCHVHIEVGYAASCAVSGLESSSAAGAIAVAEANAQARLLSVVSDPQEAETDAA